MMALDQQGMSGEEFGIHSTGTTAAVMDHGRDPTEATKRLDGMLLAGDAVISIDNIEAAIEGAALCKTLTQGSRRIRPLGASVMVTVPCTALLTLNGNNLTLRGDIVRRVRCLLTHFWRQEDTAPRMRSDDGGQAWPRRSCLRIGS